MSDVKGTLLRDVIETHPSIVEWLTNAKLPELRKCLWYSYIQKNIGLYNDLCAKYLDLSKEIEKVDIDDTQWKRALDIFKKRFSVPYTMEISNLKGAVIGESIPKVEFSFTDGDRTVKISRERLDEVNTLSQGEKRALYLLNIIFEIEEIKRQGTNALFIVDDIADSFDYKNKYAIVEYLYEIAQDERFSMIILSHNFDFYRTISSRLNLNRKNRLIANVRETGTELVEEHYQNQPFEYWKAHLDEKNILAMIPFVRNLAEYGNDRCVYKEKVNTSSSYTDCKVLSNLLHEKETALDIRFADLQTMYSTYLGIKHFQDDIDLSKNVIAALYEICDKLTEVDTELENKILLAMAIRHKAEIFMKAELKVYGGHLIWIKKKCRVKGTADDFIHFVDSSTNQTRELLNGYKQFGEPEKISVLEQVAIMTPENIHINSFMYEPIMDMDVLELLELYKQVNKLLKRVISKHS